MLGLSNVAVALVREQWRAQRRYAMTAGGLVALATALAAFAVVSVETQAAARVEVLVAGGWDADNSALLAGWSDGVGYLHGEPVEPALARTPAQVEAMVADAAAHGIEVAVHEAVYVRFAQDPDRGMAMHAVDDAIAERQLYAGVIPGPGEIALTTATANLLGLTIGDTVTAMGEESDGVPAAEPLDLTVVGLTLSELYDGAAAGTGGLIAREDVVPLARVSGGLATVNADGERTGRYDVNLLWDGPMLDGLDGAWVAVGTTSESPWTGVAAPTEWFALLGAAALAIVAVGAAIAAGRSQAEARTRWVATARALGATRADIVRAGVIEGAAIGVIAGTVGIAAGWGVAAIRHGLERAAHPDTYGPSLAVLPLRYAVVLVAAAILVSLVIGLVPALWAARVEPSAALQPAGPTDLRGRDARRRTVSPVWLAVIGCAALALLVGNAPSTTGAWDALGIAASIALAAAVALYVGLALRGAIPRLGSALARTGRPPLVLAADSLTHRTGALVPAATGMLLAAIAAFMTVRSMGAPPVRDVLDGMLPWWLGSALLMLAGGLVMGLAEWMGRGGALREAATAGALGLDRNARQLAAMVRVAAPMTLGVMAGAVTGALLACGAAMVEAVHGTPAATWTGVATMAAWALVGALGVVVASVSGVGIAALFAARGVDARSPQEAARLAR